MSTTRELPAPVTIGDPASPTGATVVRPEIGLCDGQPTGRIEVRHETRSAWNGTVNECSTFAGPMDKATAVTVARALMAFAADEPERADRPLIAWTLGDAEALAGRALTDDEAERVAKAFEHSSAGESFAAVVDAVAGLEDDDAAS